MNRNRIEDEGPPNPRQAEVDRTRDLATKQANAPRTSGGVSAPQFGSPGRSGAEREPGPAKS